MNLSILDQKVIAGLGNIYVDECLWKSKIDPNSISNAIPKKKAASLHFNIRQTLQNAIKKQGTTIIDFTVNGESGKYTNELQVFGREDLSCFTCKNKIIKVRVAGRGTYICQRCQKIYKRY